MRDNSDSRPRVGLFVTCLVDLIRPSVGFAAVKLLEDAGCDVSVPATQTCCGQPAYNSGDRPNATEIARSAIEAFDGYDYVVVPSGSCSGMLTKHYPELFVNSDAMASRARDLARRTYELISFLTDVCGVAEVNATFDGAITYHDSCSSLREMGVSAQPRKLLQSIQGIELRELTFNEACCGFGGTFCVKYPDISNKMVGDKCADIQETGASMVLAGDMGCLMNIAGKLKREGAAVEVRHVAEVLAGMTDVPAIGEME
ncbi:MAG: (Fe-S)-binding protein [Pseudomonadota bacterium]|nr:(Fe-S)-binding protein [Pseudomonadota bacterium]